MLCAGICALILTVGLARFAYTPLLPIMHREAGLSDVTGGWLATAMRAICSVYCSRPGPRIYSANTSCIALGW